MVDFRALHARKPVQKIGTSSPSTSTTYENDIYPDLMAACSADSCTIRLTDGSSIVGKLQYDPKTVTLTVQQPTGLTTQLPIGKILKIDEIRTKPCRLPLRLLPPISPWQALQLPWRRAGRLP